MYGDFATNYDDMMGELPYDRWFDMAYRYLLDQGKGQGSLCELGCGTGTMTQKFFDKGYEILALDLSEEMLAIAREKNSEIFYIHQDMTELDLGQEVDLFVSFGDSMNYLVEPEDMALALQGIARHLKSDGLLLFDLKTEYCYTQIMGDVTRVEDQEDYVSIWENTYFPEEKINQYSLTIFQRQGDLDLYHRVEEVHHQRVYSRGEIEALLDQAGLCLKAWLGPDFEPTETDQVERVYVVAQPKEGM